jgi:hypothetical protein
MELARHAVKELEALLEQSDVRAKLKARESAPLLRAALGEPFNELARNIENYDFENALSLLGRLEASIRNSHFAP